MDDMNYWVIGYIMGSIVTSFLVNVLLNKIVKNRVDQYYKEKYLYSRREV